MRNALSRHSSSHSGSFFLAEISLTTSSLSPFGISSASTSVTKPYLYSRVASSSIVSVLVDISLCSHPGFRDLGLARSRVKREPAPARALRVRVVELEAAAHQARVVIELGAVKQAVALRIDENSSAAGADEHAVGRARLFFPREHVLVA